jgi:hypothetical protein
VTAGSGWSATERHRCGRSAVLALVNRPSVLHDLTNLKLPALEAVPALPFLALRHPPSERRLCP